MKKAENPYLLELQTIRLKECLKESGLSQKQVAEKLNYTEQHISYVINGKRKLTKELAIKLAEVFSQQKNLKSLSIFRIPSSQSTKRRIIHYKI